MGQTCVHRTNHICVVTMPLLLTSRRMFIFGRKLMWWCYMKMARVSPNVSPTWQSCAELQEVTARRSCASNPSAFKLKWELRVPRSWPQPLLLPTCCSGCLNGSNPPQPNTAPRCAWNFSMAISCKVRSSGEEMPFPNEKGYLPHFPLKLRRGCDKHVPIVDCEQNQKSFWGAPDYSHFLPRGLF